MIDIRYHIYSLAAVFFALAVGIVIGTSFANRQPATRAEQRTIRSYANSMRVLKQEIENAARKSSQDMAAARNSEEFCQAVLPAVLKDRLAGRDVAIIQTGDYSDLTGAVKRAIEDAAGARVTDIIDMSRTFSFGDDHKIGQALADCSVFVSGDGKSARDKLFAIIAESVCYGAHSQLLSKLENVGIARFTGDSDRANKLVVLIGGDGPDGCNTADVIDNQLITQFDRLGATVVGCEGSTAAISFVPSWQKMGMATVDNIDSAIGQAAMVCALNGENAAFGFKPTADRLIPETLEQ